MKAIFMPTSKELIESSFARARKAAGLTGKSRDRIKYLKIVELRKLETVTNCITERLTHSLQSFPDFENGSLFYQELWDILVGLQKTRRVKNRLWNATKLLRTLKRMYSVKIKQERNQDKIRKCVPPFYGRVASVVKSLEKDFEKYNQMAQRLKELPDLASNQVCVVIAGMPNVGKSTLLARVTQAKPQIASYPFTTQQLNLGELEVNYERVQIIDTPGLLDRALEEHNVIERKAITALRHLEGGIIFVMDASEQCGFTIEQQTKVLESIHKNFRGKPLQVMINKKDIARKDQIQKAVESIHIPGVKSYLTGADDKSIQRIFKDIVLVWVKEKQKKEQELEIL